MSMYINSESTSLEYTPTGLMRDYNIEIDDSMTLLDSHYDYDENCISVSVIGGDFNDKKEITITKPYYRVNERW